MSLNNNMTLKNSLGLSFEFLKNGSLKSIEVDPIRISLKAETLFSKPGTNLYLRKRKKAFEFTALLGPEGNSLFKMAADAFIARGSWAGLDYTCVLQLSKNSLSWQWSVDIKNLSDNPVELDLIYVQDAGLKPVNAGLINEYYVSQYLERRILEDKIFGAVACCRQNTKESTGHPWFMMACKNTAVAGSVDGMQFYGKTYRETGIPEGLLADNPGGDYAGESSVFALQEKPFSVTVGGVHNSVFVGTYLPDHPQATSEDDLNRLPSLMLECNDGTPSQHANDLILPARNLFNITPFLPVDDLNDDELNRFFDKERRHCEDEDGRLLSFFSAQNNHVVLRAKEVMADRPHAHIMQARAGYVPDESIMSTTSFAFGVFNSHITQGNTIFNVLLSVCTSQFNLAPETGQRIFVEVDGRRYLLGVPSAFEMGLNHCRWIYKHGNYCFQVRSWTSKTAPQVNMDFKVISGNKVKLLITHDFDALDGWTIYPGSKAGEYMAKPKADSMIAGKFPDARFRILISSTGSDYRACGDEALYPHHNGQGGCLFVLDVRETADFCMSFIGEAHSAADAVTFEDPDRQWLSDCQDAQSSWKDLSLNLSLQGTQEDIAAIQEILPWYGMNAITHFLTPYGLEQFSGAAWGTRDVSQGPLDLLLTLEKYDEARQVLCIIFSNQNPDGGWPQWWMFDSYSNIRADSSHDDIFYWCIIALSNYVKVTGDLKILDEVLPYYHEKGPAQAEQRPLSEHVDRLIKMIVDSFIPGTAFVPFGGGDWNDSLQPVSKELAQRMISSWTVEMNYQAFSQYQLVYEQTSNTRKAGELKEICETIKADFNKYLVKDGVVAGYGLVEDDRSISVLLHPSDTTTGIQYSILPMNRGIISEIFTSEQAQHHQDLIEQHLKGPDGARLMDRPLRYKGGIQTIFQRAESSTFFGREIGLMYVHEHIRYAESQACTGRADAFMKALRQAIPVGYRDVVPCGDIRQSNCYYSSSDVTFGNRYEADERYDEIQTGKITLRGGWRVYSSGPGVYIGLVVSRLLGLRIVFGKIIVDPVMPHSLDGLSASLDLLDHAVTFNYAVKEGNFSPKAVSINGKAIQFKYEENKYRKGGAVISAEQFLAMLDRQQNIVEVRL
jgi:cellobiose phosphorylase